MEKIVETIPEMILCSLITLQRGPVLHSPFPHVEADTFFARPLFKALFANMPDEKEFAPLPSQKYAGEAARFHYWISRSDRPFWQSIYASFNSAEALSLQGKILGQLGGSNMISRCDIRLCVDKLPMILRRHVDSNEKAYSLVLFIHAQGIRNCGTELFGNNESQTKKVEFSPNKAIMFARSDNAWHGGDWSKCQTVRRITLQIFGF